MYNPFKKGVLDALMVVMFVIFMVIVAVKLVEFLYDQVAPLPSDPKAPEVGEYRKVIGYVHMNNKRMKDKEVVAICLNGPGFIEKTVTNRKGRYAGFVKSNSFPCFLKAKNVASKQSHYYIERNNDSMKVIIENNKEATLLERIHQEVTDAPLSLYSYTDGRNYSESVVGGTIFNRYENYEPRYDKEVNIVNNGVVDGTINNFTHNMLLAKTGLYGITSRYSYFPLSSWDSNSEVMVVNENHKAKYRHMEGVTINNDCINISKSSLMKRFFSDSFLDNIVVYRGGKTDDKDYFKGYYDLQSDKYMRLISKERFTLKYIDQYYHQNRKTKQMEVPYHQLSNHLDAICAFKKETF